MFSSMAGWFASDWSGLFGDEATLLVGGATPGTAVNASIDRTSGRTLDLFDGQGQRIKADALITLPATIEVNLQADQIECDGVRWHFAAELERYSTAVTYVVTQTRHSIVRVVRMPGQRSGS